jgi:hemoglobin
MKHDIANRQDVELLVNTFYDHVRKDARIGYIFNETIGDDWSHHLPRMYSFWEMVLLGQSGYTGNPVRTHLELDKKMPLEKAHFDAWLELWATTIDSLFAGEIADLAKNRGMLMANLINMKIDMGKSGHMIQ